VREAAIFYILTVLGLILILREVRKMAVDLTAQFSNLDAAIAALPARITAAEAGAIQPADVQAAADARAATITALPLPPAP
jgi:hypothetical protein